MNMIGQQEYLTVTLILEPETQKEVDTLMWLSKNLVSSEWQKVLEFIGERRLLELPIEVMDLSARAKEILKVEYHIQKLGDLVKLSRWVLRRNMRPVAFDALMRKVELFGLHLCA